MLKNSLNELVLMFFKKRFQFPKSDEKRVYSQYWRVLGTVFCPLRIKPLKVKFFCS